MPEPMSETDQTTASAGCPSGDPEHPFRYTALLAEAIETRWQTWWEEHAVFRALNPGDPDFDATRPKFYCLDMFPYPSGAGLHVGHPEGYTASDIVSRYKRHRGFNVLHPMGWDAFGLPAEQYAIQTGVHPAVTTRKAIDTFRRQLKRFGFSYDWSREFATIDPAYYQWTQWIWLKAYHAWFDPSAGRARPIEELEQEFERNPAAIRMNPSHTLHKAGASMERWVDTSVSKPWGQYSPSERKTILDSWRLAYLSNQIVNWCPELGTVLANEEVIDGRSERGGFPVRRQPLKQWMFRITAYADRLLADLDHVDWPESTRIMQREWIGRSEGAEIDFSLCEQAGDLTALRVFTTRPDTIFGATYMVVAPEHALVQALLAHPQPETDIARLRAYVEAARGKSDVDRQAEAKEKTGVFTGAYALNPATNERIPVWTSEYVLIGYGHGAIMAVPGHDQRDFEFARKFTLPVRPVVMPPESWLQSHVTAFTEIVGDDPSRLRKPSAAKVYAAAGDELFFMITDASYEADGLAINSANDEISLNDQSTPDAKSTIIDWLETTGRGVRRVNYRLRDWLFSRQRYWGEPFPIVYDEAGNHYPIDAAHLPVLLPEMEDYRPIRSDTPQPPLAKVENWVNTTAGAAGVSPELLDPDTPVRRETNTMPGWAGSCWYYLRYGDPNNAARFIARDAEAYWMRSLKRGPRERGERADGPFDPARHHVGGVDLYIGGAEHAVLHLLYARFWHKMLFDLGEVSTPEPMGKLFHQGMITSYAYQRADKSLVAVDEVDVLGDDHFVERATGARVARINAKMSKSLKNVVNPDDIIAEYSADTFRLYEMYMGPLEASKPWNTRDMAGPFRFLQRFWRLVVNERTGELNLAETSDAVIEKQLHRTIAKVEGDIERLAFNTAIAAMIEFVNTATSVAASRTVGGAGGASLTRDQVERFIIVLAPFAPHMAEDIRRRLGYEGSIAHIPWPAHDPALLVEDEIEIAVQIMGKVRGRVRMAADAEAHVMEQTALADEKIQALLEGLTVRKVIVVPGKLVNIVAN